MKKSVRPARLAALSLALVLAFPLSSRSQSSESLKEVVVTASRVPTPVTDVIADVSIIDRVTLDQSGQSSLREVLSSQPGVQLTTNGSYRSTAGIFLRGASSSQTIVLIDGVRVGSATSGTAALENIPLERVERIEILRGAASALYGPDAVGGVIQIFTREPTENLQINANAGLGNDGQRQAGASVRGASGALGYSIGISTEKAGGISSTTNPAASSFNPDMDGFTTRSTDAKLKAKLSAQHALTLSLLQSKTEYQFDGKLTPSPLALTKLTTDAWAKPNLNNATFKWDAQWQPLWKSSLILGTSDEDSVSEYYRMSDGAFDGRSKFNTKRAQATWQNDISLGKDVLSVLLERRSEAVDSSTNYTVKDREIRSALLSYAFNQTKWNALAVLRNDDNSQFGSFNNWALSGGYKMTNNLRAVASVGTSFQAPTFNQLYYPDYGTPTLTPQMNRASEVGLKYSQGAVTWSMVAYHNAIQGFIAPATNTQSALAQLRGVTLSAAIQQGNTNYSVSYDQADPRSEPGNLRLVRTAQSILNLRATHRLGDVDWFGELRLSSDREDFRVVAPTTVRETLPGYALFNVGAKWRLQKNLSVLARLNNVTDSQYSLANGYSMPGRNAFVSLSWSM